MLKPLVVILSSILFFFLLLFLFVKLAGPIPFAVNSIVTTKSDVFTVSGEGTSSQKPDTAVIRVGVTANGSTVKAAQDLLNSNINKVSEAIKGLGVDAKDIQTENYNINPSYDYTAGQKITGYNANTNLTVKVRDITKVNAVIDGATASGANQVSGVSFQVADQEKAENEARQNAVASAKKKADQAAKIAGFKLGSIINYSENFNGNPSPVSYAIGAADLKQATPPTQVEPGSAEIKVTVNLSYQIL